LVGSGGAEVERLLLEAMRFAEPVRIEELALVAQMSPSAFHRQFKAITSMTALQYIAHGAVERT